MFDLIILAGGKGTRLKKYSHGKPKPLVKIQKKPFLDYLLFNISKFNFSKIFIIAGYKGKLIKNFYHNKTINLSKIEVVIEKDLKGTGGALFEVKNKIKNDFFVINGDTLFDIDFFELPKILNNTSICSVALTKNKNYMSNYKLVNLNIDKTNNLIYSKKNKLMNGGIYFFKKVFLKSIKNSYLSLEKDILPILIKKKMVKAKKFNSFFLDIGTPNNFNYAKNKFKEIFFKPAIFLDRDGVLNYDEGYTYKIKDLKLINKTIKFLKKKNNHYKFIVTNQAGIAKKKFNLKNFVNFQKKLLFELSKYKIYINDTKFCPHHPHGAIKKLKLYCDCRKPNIKMFKDLSKFWPINHKKSIMIGDKMTDKIAANNFGIKYKHVDKIK
jgi:D,D-heptose 1,7-bisphosphate phosphatase